MYSFIKFIIQLIFAKRITFHAKSVIFGKRGHSKQKLVKSVIYCIIKIMLMVETQCMPVMEKYHTP